MSTDDSIRYLSEIRVEGFTAPTHSAVPPLLRSKPPVDQRSGRYGIVTHAFPRLIFHGEPFQYSRVHCQIDYPSPFEVLSRLAQAVGGTISLSSAGQKDRELLRRLGDISEAYSTLKSGPLRRLIDEFLLSDKDFEKELHRGNMRFQAGGDRYLQPSAIRRALHRAVDDMSGALSKWVQQGVIHYGLALRCKFCSRSSFFAWDEISDQRVRCTQCLNHFDVTPDAACGWEPVAALNAVVAGAFRDDCLEELALAHWLSEAGQMKCMVVGTEWSAPGVKCEIDVAGTVEGALVLGEAKSEDTVLKDQMRKYETLAQLLQARVLVFATKADRWNSATSERFRELAARVPRVRVESWTDLHADAGPRMAVI